MSERLRTSVDSFSIVNGVCQEKTSNLSVIEHSTIIPDRRGRGNLYVLVETIGNFLDHAQIQQRIINIAQEYFRTSGSITAGIRTVIKAANAYLFEENLNAPREQRGVAGITCMVLKNRDAYIGQSGPALLYHIGKGQFQILPKESTWLTSEKLQDVDISRHPPLGLRRDMEPELSHLYVREGDVLILASTPLAKLISQDEITSAAIHRGVHSVRVNLETLARGRDVSVLIIEIQRAGVAPAEVALSTAGPAAQPSLWRRISSAIREAFFPAPKVPEIVERGEEMKGPLWRDHLKNTVRSAGHTLSALGHGLATLLVRILPEPEPGQRTKRRYTRKAGATTTVQVDRRWLWVALLIPLMIILLFAFTRFQHERARQAHLKQLAQSVQAAKATAQASPTAAEQRAKLGEALTLLNEALQLKPEDAELLEQRKEIMEWLDRINHVSRISLKLLKEFPDTDSAKSELSTLIVQGVDVYVLDEGTDRVYKYLLNETGDELQVLPTDPVLLHKDAQIGEVTVDELLDIAWVEASDKRETNTLIILDKKGHVLEYNPTTEVIRALPSADSSTWRAPVAAAGYYGRLYLLDPSANRVLKYILTNVGYDGPPSDYLPVEAEANIHNAIDIAIDGNVYILHADGMITKYQKGSSVPFPQNNLDEPLKTPSCIFASGLMDEGGYVYVVDAGNQRIVQFSKTGEFLQQFRTQDPSCMEAMKALFVDEVQRKIYFINRNKLYLAPWPEAGDLSTP